jgi:hypothetical protein
MAFDGGSHTGFREVFEAMVASGELTSFSQVLPALTEATRGHEASLAELVQVGKEAHPDVILVVTPNGFGHDPLWVRRFLGSCGNPAVLYYEADPWGASVKPINQSMAAWLSTANIVFTVAREPHLSLFRKNGARDVRFIPQTYCPVAFGEHERTTPRHQGGLSYDIVIIGNGHARWGRVSRLPGAVQRAKLVRKLQRTTGLRVAIYGSGWSGRGVKGPLPYPQQATAIRAGLMQVNWDHFPDHESYSGDRLPIGMIAGRVQVTTAHPRMDWIPGEEVGVFQEATIKAVLRRVQQLKAMSVDDVLALGIAAHRWVRNRLSHRQAGRFMLGAVDKSLLEKLPPDPWASFAAEWPH